MKASKITALIVALSASCFSISAPVYAADALPKTDLNAPTWLNSQELLVAHNGTNSMEYYKVNIHSKAASLFIDEAADATELAVSPDGSKVAYINNNGDVFVMTTDGDKAVKVSADNAAKSDLTWTADGGKLYFCQGDKMDAIASIDLASGKTTVVLADGVPYKSNLTISFDGKKALYLVNMTASIDESKNFAVNTANTDPQYYTLNLADSKAKAVKLTSTADNKSYGTFLADGSIVYVTNDTSKEGSIPAIHKLSADGKTNTSFAQNTNIIKPLETSDGKLFLLAPDSSNQNKVYTIHPSLLKIEKFNVDNDAEGVVISPDGNQVASIVKDGDHTKLVVTSADSTNPLN